jgi:hypothetical protein
MQHIGHDSQRAAAPRANSGLVFLELDPSLPDRRRGELDTGTGEPGGDEEQRRQKRADSGDCGRGFRLIADSDSDRSRTEFR